MKFIWKESEGRYYPSYILWVGKCPVGEVSSTLFLRGAPRKPNEPKYEAICRLPGTRECLGYFYEQQTAKEHLEEVVKLWFEAANND